MQELTKEHTHVKVVSRNYKKHGTPKNDHKGDFKYCNQIRTEHRRDEGIYTVEIKHNFNKYMSDWKRRFIEVI